MQKVAIVGCGGSGKSHLARELGRLIDAPVTHLDVEYFDDEWNPLPMEKFEARQRDLIGSARWVIDGNYNSTLHVRLEAADTVIFMDLPTRSCIRGILARQLRHGRGQNRGSGVFNRISPGVLWYVLGYRRTMRPRVQAKIDQFASGTEIIVLKSRRQARQFLSATRIRRIIPSPIR